MPSIASEGRGRAEYRDAIVSLTTRARKVTSGLRFGLILRSQHDDSPRGYGRQGWLTMCALPRVASAEEVPPAH